jgi:hypothetical protein
MISLPWLSLAGPRWQVSCNRHRIQVAGNDDPLRAAELGSGEDHIAVSPHIQVAVPLERLLHQSAISVSLPLTDSTSINARSSWTTSPSMSRGEDTSGTLQRR